MKTLFITLLLTLSLNAEIIEIKHLSEINQHLKKESLIVFDIDNTLIEPKQLLGSDQWGSYQIQKYQEQGLSKEEALKKVQFEWTAIQNITEVTPVEPSTPDLLKELQNKKYPLIGLTGRAPDMAALTTHQLQTAGMQLFPTAPSKEEILFKSDATLLKSFSWVLFQNGILFTARMHKGEALFTLLQKINYTPKRIVAIDDKASCLEQIAKSCKEKNIPFTGLRYSFTDDKVKNFRTDIAEKQFTHFKQILSNEAASK